MKGRFWAVVSLIGIALAGGVYFARHTSSLQSASEQALKRLTHVEVQAITNRAGPTVNAPLIQQQTRNVSNAVAAPHQVEAAAEEPASLDDPTDEPEAAVSTVRCGDLLRKLKQTLPLSDQEEGQVQGVFKTASAIQAGIDAEQSADNRRMYQQQLVQQVVLRLKLILKDEQRVDFARSELQGLPRLEQGG